MRSFILLGLCVSASLSGCLRLSVDEERAWPCKNDSDCEGALVCKSDDGSSFADKHCRAAEWCSDDDHCADNMGCDTQASECVALGGGTGLCVEDEDCGSGHECVDRKCECVPSDEACNGGDDDCDGSTDEDFQVGEACDGQGACGAGEIECVSATTTACSTDAAGSAFEGSDERCNGQDDDCDGESDEDLGQQSCGEGACAVTVNKCEAGEAQSCEPLEPSTDVCDGEDNDCNGEVDDDPTQWLTTTTDVSVDECNDVAWQRGHRGWTTVLSEVETYCADLVLDGHDDYRVPTLAEYQALLDGCDTCKSCADSTKCPMVFLTTTGQFWTSDAKVIDLGTGESKTQTPDAYGANARCIRTP